ncbi:hypothetical protein KP509_20G029100 [Ceratopteris richardii]|uniref:Carbohydrate kinase PfkB domain-containing protein n=1 Tax=Ceratopteris richardii TaxID=49495 RepID=A0A8T2SE20_CERRI|nr:hypothetical protein KP509_20G029100 [Ceratopteris richardii]
MAIHCVPYFGAETFYTRRIRSLKMPSSVVRGHAHSSANASKEDIANSQSSGQEKLIVAGCGGLSVDYLASVARFPQPDQKIRSVDFKVQGGGNAGNCLTGAARLGLNARLLSKVAEDAFGKLVINELNGDGVDTSFITVSNFGSTSFTYIIVDQETNTRTCINSPGYPPLSPQELPDGTLTNILSGAKLLYLDGRLPEVALLLAEEARCRSIPMLIDAERKREGLDELLEIATYVVCSANFPQDWTGLSTLSEALVEIVTRLPNLKFVITTLGASGCVMLEKLSDDLPDLDVLDVNTEYQLLQDQSVRMAAKEPTVVASKVGLFRQTGPDGVSVKEFAGRLLLCTAETIPRSEIVDTTGSGDAFIAAVLFGICTQMSPERMLPFAAVVAGANCRALGARGGLPYVHDPKLIPFLSPSM